MSSNMAPMTSRESQEFIDLPQVDLMNFKVEYVRPLFRSRSGRASDEVARGPAGTE